MKLKSITYIIAAVTAVNFAVITYVTGELNVEEGESAFYTEYEAKGTSFDINIDSVID